MKRFVLLTIFVLMVASLPQAALANEAENNRYPDTGGYKIDGRIYDTLKEIGVPIPSKIEAIRFPGTCLILEQKWCDEMQKIGSRESALVMFFSLPVGTPVFAPMYGFISNDGNDFFKDEENSRRQILVFNDKINTTYLSSEKFYFYAYGIEMFHGLNSPALRVVRINKGDVLFRITENTALFKEGENDVVLVTFHYKLVATSRGTKEWVDVTFGPPFE